MGQAIGLAMRGLRPIAEIQYLDYVLYALQTLSDDLATLCAGAPPAAQTAPVIVRTRGHRLEGIWHSGSPMAGILHLLRGIWVCVPRDMTQAAGIYNTLLAADDPAIVVEVLNGYRLKERLPANVGEFRVPLGVPEMLRQGRDVTLVTYGACCRIVLEAAELLARRRHRGRGHRRADAVALRSRGPDPRQPAQDEPPRVRRRGRARRRDGLHDAADRRAQGGFWWLDAPPVTVTGREHRPAYGSDGDYFSKPSREEVFRAVYDLMRDAAPQQIPVVVLARPSRLRSPPRTAAAPS